MTRETSFTILTREVEALQVTQTLAHQTQEIKVYRLYRHGSKIIQLRKPSKLDRIRQVMGLSDILGSLLANFPSMMGQQLRPIPRKERVVGLHFQMKCSRRT